MKKTTQQPLENPSNVCHAQWGRGPAGHVPRRGKSKCGIPLLLSAFLLTLSFTALAQQDDGGLGGNTPHPPKLTPKSKPKPAPATPAPTTPTPATPNPTTPATPNTNTDPTVSSAPHEPYDTAPPNKLFTPPAPSKGDPIPPEALNGTWTGMGITYTISISGTQVQISGKRTWSGTYDPVAGTMTLTHKPDADEMDKNAPAFAKANLAGQLTWYMTLTVRHTPGTAASLEINGQWFEGAIDWQPKPDNDKTAGVKHLSWFSEGEPQKPFSIKKIRSI